MAVSTWCMSDVNFSFFPCLATCRTRSSACDTLSRSCARRVLCWPTFPLVPVLRSTGSAADCSALFVGFAATTTESDFSGSFITGYDSSSSRCGPAVSIRRPNARPPGSRAKSFHNCQGLRPRQAGRTLALTRPSMLPSVKMNTSAPGTFSFRGSMAGLCAPLPTLRRHPRGCQRTARGRCGSLLLHRSGLPPPTLCRFRPAHQKNSLDLKSLFCCTNPVHNYVPMIYGYARVSTDGQSVDAQVKQLRDAGAEKVFRETASGARSDRAQLRRALDQFDKGDVLMVTRLDRLARSTRDLLNTMAFPAYQPIAATGGA